MDKNQEKVIEFHKMFGSTINFIPQIPSEKDIELRINLIYEEAKEVKDASLEKDIQQVAKELADLLYVVYGTCITWGIDIEPIFDEVHRSNMSKIWEDGKIRFRNDGKVLKPPTYSKAMINLTNIEFNHMRV